MDKIEKIKICINILSVEVEKIAKKYTEIDNQINEDYTISERKFKSLDNKRDFLKENMETIYYGIAILEDELKQQKYLERMKNG